MSIKSDNWIIEQAEKNQLIKPFEKEQIREVDNKKVISYGVSSYGYDVRCANEFKIFTNTFSSVVDPKNFDEKSFLQVNFDKDALIEVFKELKIPVVGNSRPVVLILMKVDSGSMDPYFVTSYAINNSIDELIQNAIFNYSNSRGIFIELPDIDLTDRFDLLKYEKLIDSKDFISSKYLSDKVVTIDLTKVGLNNWSVTGDVNNQYSNDEFYEDFFEDFDSYIESEIDILLSKNAVDITKEELIKIHINNINTLLDYKESRRIIENMIGTIQMKIISFDTDEIGFEVRMLGGFKTLEKQITENSFFEIIQGSFNDKYLRLEYKQ